jgi:hypothetical protein
MKQTNLVGIKQLKSFNSLRKKLEECDCNDWIFRGVSDANYKLVPSLLRKESTYFELCRKNHILDPQEFEEYPVRSLFSEELLLLSHFYRLVNRQGLNVTKVDVLNRLIRLYTFAEENNGLPKNWYNPEFEDLVALTQHYGLPTRMLDWTYDPYVAIYFAVINASKKLLTQKTDINQSCFSIWLFPVEVQAAVSDKLRFVTPNYFNNPNLCAQKGVLMYWQSDVEQEKLLTKKFNEENRESLNEKISKYLATKYPARNVIHRQITRYDLKYSELSVALDFLIKMGFTASKYFSGFNGIKRAIDEIEIKYQIDKLLN